MSGRIDLVELSRRESEQTEWKENVADPDAVVATLAAFANDLQNLVSPGPLPLGITLEDIRARPVTPRWRNQALAWYLSRLQLAQAEGQGIQTIRHTMQAAGCPPPIFDANEVSVSCTLPAHPRLRSASRLSGS